MVDSGGREVCTIADAWVDLANGYHGGRVAAAESGEWVRDEDGALSFAAAPGSLGYRDERGGLAVEFQFDGAEPFSDGLAAGGETKPQASAPSPSRKHTAASPSEKGSAPSN